jgi:hypothetical protein
MALRRIGLWVAVVGFGVVAQATTAWANATVEVERACQPRDFVENTVSHVQTAAREIGRFAARTGITIGRQSRRIAETFRDAGEEIWASARGEERER